MNWHEYKEHLKDELEFRKRNPEILIVEFGMIIFAIYCIFFKDEN